MLEKRTAESVLMQMQKLFAGKPGFQEITVKGVKKFVRDFPGKNLKVVVATPVTENMEGALGLTKGLHIMLSLEFENERCLEFRDSRIIEGWVEVAEEKIETLVELALMVNPCPQCQSPSYPDPKGKNFICSSGDCTSKNRKFRASTSLRIRILYYLK